MSEEEKISSDVAFTIITELRDQIKVKDMRISKLKEKNAELIELLKELFETADLAYCEEDLLDKIDEVLKCGNVL